MKTIPHHIQSRPLFMLAILVVACVFGPVDLPAQLPTPNPPDSMSYQGFLVDANGNPLGNTNAGPKNYDVIFRIYASANSATVLWAEQQTVTVDKGYFSVLLGEGSPVPSESRPGISGLFSGSDASDRFVEMTVKGIGSGGANVTILPRLRLLPSPYSFLSSHSLSASRLVNATNANIVSIVGTNVGIGRATPLAALDVNGTVIGTAFSGAGSNLTSLNASNISSGTLADARLGTNVALLNRGPQIFSGNIGINTSTGPSANTLQIGNTFHGANGYALQVNHPTFGANIQISKTAGQGGNAMIIDNSANGDASTSLLLVRNNVAASPFNIFNVRSDGWTLLNNAAASTINVSQLNVGNAASLNGGSDYINFNSVGYHFFNVNGVLKFHIAHGTANFTVPVTGPSFTPSSDRNLKENFVEVDRTAILQKLVRLPLTTWNFKNEKGVKHLGPVAQDFHAAFAIGKDDKGITTVDADGVAFASIQALHEMVTEKDKEIQELRSELKEIREVVKELARARKAAARE